MMDSFRAKPTLTVVVPARNEERLIGDCLSALREQVAWIDEIVVVDNGSTDGTKGVVEEFRSGCDIIRLIEEPRPGVVYARTAGFDAARSEIIARVDADTRVEPGWASSISELFSAPGNQFAVVCGEFYLSDAPIAGIHRRIAARTSAKRPALRRSVILNGGNMAMEKASWEKVRGVTSQRSDIHEDIDLGLCLIESGFAIGLAPTLRACTSARRFRTSPFAYTEHVRGIKRTFEAHGLWHRRLSILLVATTVTHLAVWSSIVVGQAVSFVSRRRRPRLPAPARPSNIA